MRALIDKMDFTKSNNFKTELATVHDICKKCGEIDNQVRENKLQYSHSQFIEFINKWFIVGSFLLCLINAYLGLTILISSIISYFIIRKVGLLTKCISCGSINSFSPAKKYMKK